MSGRYAIYFAPGPETALDRFGRYWLGYDAATGTALEQPRVTSLPPARLHEITADPRRYGFHATLKPPFTLASGRTPKQLEAKLVSYVAERRVFRTPQLRLDLVAGFWALVFSDVSPEMDRLAADCVAVFDGFRAAPGAAEVAQRRATGLSRRQDELLQRWGYPYVMEEFRFHMTLTNRLEEPEREAVGAHLAPLVAPLCSEPLRVEAIALFYQENRVAPFRLMRRFPLAPSPTLG